MTKKDYEKFAAMMQRLRRQERYDATNSIVVRCSDIEGELAAIFLADNPRFDAKRFYSACITGTPKERPL